MTVKNNVVVSATVNMGAPITKPEDIPVSLEGDIVLGRVINIAEQDFAITCASMGNPHCVTFVADPDNMDLPKIGSLFENNPIFPDRINTEFVSVLDANTLKMRVWERGSGETLACGTGACATVAAAVLNGYCEKDKDIKLKLKGGELVIRWDSKSNDIFMTGPAVTVFTGKTEI